MARSALRHRLSETDNLARADEQQEETEMRRKVFDTLASAGGVVVVVVLLVAGGLFDVGLQLHQLERPQPARPAGDLLPAQGGLRTPQAGHGDHPGDDPVRLPVRRPAAAHRRSRRGRGQTTSSPCTCSEMPYDGVYAKVSTAARANRADKQLAANWSRPPSRARPCGGCCSRRTPSRPSAK